MLLGQGRGKKEWRVFYELNENDEPKEYSELMTKKVAKEYCAIFNGLFIENINTRKRINGKNIVFKVKMNYFYPDVYALRFKLRGGQINCFWRGLFCGIKIRKDGLHQLKIDYRCFIIFWESFFDGIKGLFTGKVLP